jgi:hypothetical protein
MIKAANVLLQLREPVNKCPDFVRYIVQRLKTLSSAMGKVKTAETPCRAGLHLGGTILSSLSTLVLPEKSGAIFSNSKVLTADDSFIA